MITAHELAGCADRAKVLVSKFDGELATVDDWKIFAEEINSLIVFALQNTPIECPECGHIAFCEIDLEKQDISTQREADLLAIGHCPWDVEQEDEGDPLPEPHCHANRDGECTFAYCPQPVVRWLNVRQQLSRTKGSERDES